MGRRLAVSVRDGTAIGYDDPNALCHLTVRLMGNRLLVDNPDECGGANVTFTGAYRRAARGTRSAPIDTSSSLDSAISTRASRHGPG